MVAPQRIVSLVPSTTESVCEFGAAARLIACTQYCTEPASVVATLPRIRGTKNPDREAILQLRPDLVLGNAEENRPEDLDWLRARVAMLVQTPCTVAEAAQCLRELAVRLGDAEAAQPFLLRIEAQLAAAGVDSLAASPSALRVYYAVWAKPWMSANRHTFVHDVLQRFGARNVCADDAARYPEVSPTDAVARGVDVVLLASEPWEFDAQQREVLLTKRTFGDARLVLCDGRAFCWHGVRMADGLGDARRLFRQLRTGAAR
jgi:ABC-type Fe3+-hydroxamate transport system substrate-binding protein